MTTQVSAPAFDEARAEQFVYTVLGNTAAAAATFVAGIGDKLGLWASLAKRCSQERKGGSDG